MIEINNIDPTYNGPLNSI